MYVRQTTLATTILQHDVRTLRILTNGYKINLIKELHEETIDPPLGDVDRTRLVRNVGHFYEHFNELENNEQTLPNYARYSLRHVA